MSRNTSFPASAHECAASASIDAAPVITAATVLATAMSRLAPNATTTVSVLSPWDSSVDPAADTTATGGSLGSPAAKGAMRRD